MQTKGVNNNPKPLLKKPLMRSSKPTQKPGTAIKNSKPFPENNDPTVISATSEKLWSLKNIQLALFIGFALLIIDLTLIYVLNANAVISLIILLITVVLYSISLYFLLNPPVQKTIEKERIKHVEKPTIKVVERPITRIIEKPVETIKYIEKPVVKKIITPPITVNNDPLKKYSYVASVKSKKIHSTQTTAGRMIRPENREFAHKIESLKKKGYTEGQIKPKKSVKK